ncbi:MAG: 4Fe-4S dicluster domain-containing protein, partial [Sulfolobales archaeon]
MRITGIEKAEKGYGVIVDIDRCIGCRACQLACKMWNNLPAEEISFAGSLTSPQWLTANSWKIVFFYEGTELIPLPFQCMHCRDPPCALACPVSAIVISDEGAVVINSDDCLGIGNCLRACPFNVPQRG